MSSILSTYREYVRVCVCVAYKFTKIKFQTIIVFYFTNKNNPKFLNAGGSRKNHLHAKERINVCPIANIISPHSLHPTLHTGSLHATASITNILLHFSYFPSVV